MDAITPATGSAGAAPGRAMSTVAEVLLHALKAHGAREVFGIPGDFVLPLFKVMEEKKILPLYTLAHEPAVGFAADAAARMRGGGLGVAAVTYGAGALNMVNAVAAAYAEKSPVVVLSGAPGRGEATRGLLVHHQAKTLESQYQIFREITCDQVRLDDAARAPLDIARVLQRCLTQSRPVYIEVPRDMVLAECQSVEPLAPASLEQEAVQACVQEILQRLKAARAPVMMVGVEVRRFGLEEKVAALARFLGVPVVTSMLGRGLLAGANSPLVGTYLGVAGRPEVTALVENSDCLLLLGVIVSDTNFGVSARQIDWRRTIHALDEEVSLGYHTFFDIPLAALVEQLLEQIQQEGHLAASREGGPAAVGQVLGEPYPRGMPADDAAIAPQDIAAAINDLMDVRGKMPIAADIGDCLFTAFDIDHTALVAPGYYATMGFGVPAGLGLQAATGERPLILVGDGAFQMTGWELGHCGRYGWDPVVVVFNNASWGMLHAFQPESAFNQLGAWRYAELATALGGDGVRVQTRRQWAQALTQAAAKRGRFQLIEVMLPPGVLSRTLTRFVGGAKQANSAPARSHAG